MERLRREFQEAVDLLNDIPAWVLSIFAAGCIAMNLMANKSIDLNVSWLALDCGMVFAWLPFFCMDIITKRYGAKASIITSITALLINLIMAGLFYVAAKIAGTWGESFAVADGSIVNTALDNTFAGTWYVLFGSAVAFLVSAIVNSLLNEYVGNKMKADSFGTFAARSYVSTIIGQVVDNLTFSFIVSVHFFGWTPLQCVMCSLTGAVVELISEAVFSPIGYRVTKSWDEQGVGERYLAKYRA